MSEHVTVGPPSAPPPPAWMREKLLQPGEQLVWWQGPTEARWQQWFKDHESPLIAGSFFAMAACVVVGQALGTAGLFLGLLLGVGGFVTVLVIVAVAGTHKFHVLTDRRLLVVVGREKKEEFDLALLRQILAALGSVAPAAGAGAVDLSKLGQIQTAAGASSQGITDPASILALVKLAQQMNGVRLPEQAATSAAERPS